MPGFLGESTQHVCSVGKKSTDGAEVGDPGLSAQSPENKIKIHSLHEIKSQELILESCPDP